MVAMILIFVVAIIFLLIQLRAEWKQQKSLKFSFEDTMGKVGLPIVSFKQDDKDFNFIIDSGSDGSILNANFLNKLNYINLEGSRAVYGIDGNQVETSFVGVKLFSQNHKFVEIFQVMDVPAFSNLEDKDNMEISGILGNSFLRRYGFLIDYNQLKAFTNGKEHKIENS